MVIGVPKSIPSAESIGRVHFVGIGGAGLSAIARIMKQRGVSVSGCDSQDSKLLAELAGEGIEIFVGHDSAHVDDADTLIVSTALNPSTEELQYAEKRGLRVWPRSAGLQSVLVDKHVVAVAGTHGKTTTTAMLVLAMQSAGHDVGFAIGAHVPALGTNAKAGSDPIMIVEADESDGAFLVYEPTISVITNVDPDHLDHWGSSAAYQNAFADFALKAKQMAVVCADDAGVQGLTNKLNTVRTAGLSESADVRAINIQTLGAQTICDVVVDGEVRGALQLNVPGNHYLVDALVAIATALELGADFAAVANGLSAYTGAARRMQFVGERRGVRVYDTYAHHPTEIAADLSAARLLAGAGRVIVAYQPHLVSRTKLFGAQMGIELDAADVVAVTDIYLAREEHDPEVNSSIITSRIGQATLLPNADLESLPAALAAVANAGDVVVTMGAGDITKIAPRVVEAL